MIFRAYDHASEPEAHAIPEPSTHRTGCALYLAIAILVLAAVYLVDAALQLIGK